jgi:hypothetical protein
MIFHCASDKIYYEYFFKNFVDSIKKYYPNPKISYNFIGKDLPNNIETDILQIDKISWDEIKTQYKASDREAKGYYALSRWLSIPIQNEHVAVCDVDVLAVNKINHELIETCLQTHQVINLTRMKPKGAGEGGMMSMILRKDICAEVKKYSNQLLNEKKLVWARDVDIRSMLYSKYSVKNILNMYQITKNTTEKDLKSIKEWFIFSKGNVEQKNLYVKKNL